MTRESWEGKLVRERVEVAERSRPLPGAMFGGRAAGMLQKETSALSGSSVLACFWEEEIQRS